MVFGTNVDAFTLSGISGAACGVPCEPKPRPAEARNTRPAGFGTRTSLLPTEPNLKTNAGTLLIPGSVTVDAIL